jgi:adenosylcobinamide kinase / adenosylcobinamide-phosphate guanylyltransferase
VSTTPDDTKRGITLLLGGARAGKSARALAIAASGASTDRVLFVATAQPFDEEMTKRIAAHRAERPGHWQTLESPLHLVTDIADRCATTPGGFATVIVDCLTLWVSNVLLTLGDEDDAEALVAARTAELLNLCRTLSDHGAANVRPTVRHWIFVSNEVGLGVVPHTTLGRRYRDALGRANQLVAAAADRASLLVAGLELPLGKG